MDAGEQRSMLRRFRQLWVEDGWTGIAEWLFRQFAKRWWTAWYRLRFRSMGWGVVIEGRLIVRGGQAITIGARTVIGPGACLSSSGGGTLSIGSQCFIEGGVTINSNGEVILGDEVHVHRRALISGNRMVIGSKTWISHDCVLEGRDIVIGARTIFSPFAYLTDTDHAVDPQTNEISLQAGSSRPIRIGENCWICHGASILKGVTIGDHAIVGARAVVTHDVPARSLVLGIPAQVRERQPVTPLE